MKWVFLILAGIFAIVEVLMINKLHKDRNLISVVLLIAGFGLSFLSLSLAMRTSPMGTVYAVWTGIGASGGLVFSHHLWLEPCQATKRTHGVSGCR